MFSGTVFYPVRSRWSDFQTYLFAALFAIGNIALPFLCHQIPSGGQIFLPVYFFTLVAAYKFGLNVGLITAIASPLLNSVLTGMPPAAVLPVILVKSFLLAIIAWSVSTAYKKISLLHLLFVVMAYQLLGSVFEWIITGSFQAAFADLSIGIPGLLIQVFGGWLLLKKMALYEQR